jgi:hypothetical protein
LWRADDEDRSCRCEPFERALFPLAVESARARRCARKVRQPVAEGLEVLLRKQRRGHEERHLLAVGECHERGAQRDLRLAEAHVAADEAIHRLARRHVADRRLRCRGLSGVLANPKPSANAS